MISVERLLESSVSMSSQKAIAPNSLEEVPSNFHLKSSLYNSHAPLYNGSVPLHNGTAAPVAGLVPTWCILLIHFDCEANSVSQEIYLHITFAGKNTVLDRFWGHPLHRKIFRLFGGVHVFIDLTLQPKVRHLDPVIMTNQNITGCKITMDKVFFCEVILLKTNNK